MHATNSLFPKISYCLAVLLVTFSAHVLAAASDTYTVTVNRSADGTFVLEVTDPSGEIVYTATGRNEGDFEVGITEFTVVASSLPDLISTFAEGRVSQLTPAESQTFVRSQNDGSPVQGGPQSGIGAGGSPT